MRINKFLASCGVASRRKAEEFIKEGMVKVNDVVVSNLSTDIKDSDIVKLNGVIIKLTEQKVYYMLNKPKGYVSSVSDEHNRKTVIDLINDDSKRLFPVGRLDYDSEGMIILTNDGDLAFKLTHPSNKIEKTYIVKIEGKMLESELAVLRAGVVVEGERYSPCKVEVLEYNGKLSRLEVVLSEGKNREIRKMFDAIGKTIVFLKRVMIGSLRLGGVTRGTYRPLKEAEVEMLLKNKNN